jgi:signal peptidase II
MNQTVFTYLKVSVAILFLVAFDLWTKHWAAAHFMRGQTKTIIPGLFNLTLVHNTGAAFGLGAKWSMSFFVTTSVLAICLVNYLLIRLRPEERIPRWALTLILSGALGNLIDRIRQGYVVDFFDFYVRRYHWPAFNIADACITVGAGLFFLEMLLRPKKADAGSTT